jgi:lipopolysaccharide transport system ATP-binding protein
MKPVLSVNGIAKQYTLGSQPDLSKSFREMLLSVVTSPFKNFKRLSGKGSDKQTFWALDNVSFDVQAGEVVGVIGRNGAGKSTLLKILSRITTPTKGSITYQGNMASLLEVGTGFHPELTGRENIYLNGAILGMSKKLISERLDDIVEFAEIAKFLDTPVKRFSSGMYVRLAFSVAAHLDPDILIVDEVLAVGDQTFQQKCLGKLKDSAGDGRTVFFVSHNMASVKNLCTRIIYIKDGKIEYDGEPETAIRLYLSADKSENANWIDIDQKYRYLEHISLLNDQGEYTDLFQYDQDVRVGIKLTNIDQIGLTTAVRAIDSFGNIIFTSWDSDSILENIESTPAGTIIKSRNVSCTIPRKLLKPGQYTITVFVRYLTEHGKTRVEEVNLDLTISSENCIISENRSGMVAPVLNWELLRP